MNAWAQDVVVVVSTVAWRPVSGTLLVSGNTQRATEGAVTSLAALSISNVLGVLAPRAYTPSFLHYFPP